MNKRDFLIQGSGALLAGTGVVTGIGAGVGAGVPPVPRRAIAPTPTPTPAPAPSGSEAWWRALLGQPFEGHTTLGRAVTLHLHAVTPRPPAQPDTALEQFTVSFSGPRSLPLPAGTHTLRHPQAGAVALYLEPLRQGEHRHYAAHFSLLA